MLFVQAELGLLLFGKADFNLSLFSFLSFCGVNFIIYYT